MNVNEDNDMEEDNEWFELKRKEWREFRREKSERINRNATIEIQQRFCEITGLSNNIVFCDENISQPLWIDNITDLLLEKYNDNINVIKFLIDVGFSQEYIQKYGIDDECIEMLSIEEIIEALLNYALNLIDDIIEKDARGFPKIFEHIPENQLFLL